MNLTTGQLVVRRSVCHGVAAPPKSGHQRLVPLPHPLRELLDAQKDRGLDAPVSIGADGPWTQWGLLSAFRSACRRAKLKGWRFHDLRHFYVTSLFRARVPAPTVQRLAGHEHLATTQRYAHLAGIDLTSAIGDLDASSEATARQQTRLSIPSRRSPLRSRARIPPDLLGFAHSGRSGRVV